mmetsp:Transcript_21648/g.63572  ORF Transcript_21648/g.63572 Transcript_21648/m.63572 type:complete len:356 (-) Transcript_21648:159-1226(-)
MPSSSLPATSPTVALPPVPLALSAGPTAVSVPAGSCRSRSVPSLGQFSATPATTGPVVRGRCLAVSAVVVVVAAAAAAAPSIVREGSVRVSVPPSDGGVLLSSVVTALEVPHRSLGRLLFLPVVVVDGGEAGTVRPASRRRPWGAGSYRSASEAVLRNEIPVRAGELGLLLLGLLEEGLILVVKILLLLLDAHVPLVVGGGPLRRLGRQTAEYAGQEVPARRPVVLMLLLLIAGVGAHLLRQPLRIPQEARNVLPEAVSEGPHHPETPLTARVRSERRDGAGALHPDVWGGAGAGGAVMVRRRRALLRGSSPTTAWRDDGSGLFFLLLADRVDARKAVTLARAVPAGRELLPPSS